MRCFDQLKLAALRPPLPSPKLSNGKQTGTAIADNGDQIRLPQANRIGQRSLQQRNDSATQKTHGQQARSRPGGTAEVFNSE